MFQVSVTIGATQELLDALNGLASVFKTQAPEAEVTKTPRTRRATTAPAVEAPVVEASAQSEPVTEAPTPQEEEEPQQGSAIGEVAVRELVVSKSREGKKPEIRELINTYGVTGWTELIPHPARLVDFYNNLKKL